eukprot:g20322.t1
MLFDFFWCSSHTQTTPSDHSYLEKVAATTSFDVVHTGGASASASSSRGERGSGQQHPGVPGVADYCPPAVRRHWQVEVESGRGPHASLPRGISGRMFAGFKAMFGTFRSDYVITLEDDILVSERLLLRLLPLYQIVETRGRHAPRLGSEFGQAYGEDVVLTSEIDAGLEKKKQEEALGASFSTEK